MSYESRVTSLERQIEQLQKEKAEAEGKPWPPPKQFWSIRMFDTVPDSTVDHVAIFEPFCDEQTVYAWRDDTVRHFGEQFSIMIDPTENKWTPPVIPDDAFVPWTDADRAADFGDLLGESDA